MNWDTKMAENPNHNDLALDQLFASAKATTAKPSDDFLARLQLDADAMLPKTPPIELATPNFGWFQGLFTASGLSGAVVLGVWIGFVSPESLSTMNVFLATDTTVTLSDFLPAANFANTDGETLP